MELAEEARGGCRTLCLRASRATSAKRRPVPTRWFLASTEWLFLLHPFIHNTLQSDPPSPLSSPSFA